MKTKKILSLVLVLAMLLPMAALAESTYPIATDGSETLNYWTTLNASAAKFIESLADNTAYQEMEKRTGVKIEWIHPAIGQEREQFNLLMVSGELPDMVSSANYYKGGEFQGMYDGVFTDLTDLLPVYAPDYWKLIQEDPEFFREVSDENGRICAVYPYKRYGDPPFDRVFVREDVLQELGLEIPQTIEDYNVLFAKLLENGMTPFMPRREGYEPQFMSPFGVLAGTPLSGDGMITQCLFKDLDGKIYYGQTKPEFKQYLELMNGWYEAGYISKDFATADGNQRNTAFDTKQLGIMIGAIVANFNRGQTQGFGITAAPYPRLELGQQLHLEDTNIWPLQRKFDSMVVIPTSNKNPEIALRWLNYGYTPEGMDLMNWGVEGINYDVVDGKKVYNDLMLANPQFGTEEASYIYKMHFAPKNTELDTICHANLLKSPASLASRMKWADDPNVDSEFRLPPYQRTTEEQEAYTQVMTEVATYADEMVLKFITGATPLSEFENFVKTIESMGINDLLASEQVAYERYLGKQLQ